MSARDYGPVPIGRLNAEKGRIYDALAAGNRVRISRHGAVCAVIEPHHRLTAAVLAAYAVPGDPPPLDELTPTKFSDGNPSEFVANAERGIPSYVTKDRRVYGALMSNVDSVGADDDLFADQDEDDLSFAQLAIADRLVEERLQEHPDADEALVATITAEAEQHVRDQAEAEKPARPMFGVLHDFGNARVWSDDDGAVFASGAEMLPDGPNYDFSSATVTDLQFALAAAQSGAYFDDLLDLGKAAALSGDSGTASMHYAVAILVDRSSSRVLQDTLTTRSTIEQL